MWEQHSGFWVLLLELCSDAGVVVVLQVLSREEEEEEAAEEVEVEEEEWGVAEAEETTS